jgi:hypothetical protein
LKWGEIPVPTDVLLSIEERRLRKIKQAADLKACLLLIPQIVCLGSIILGMECPAFAAAITATGI